MKPLADRLRPKKIEDMIGQSHIIGEGKVLNKIIKNKSIPNMILYGPPGTGKTTLANIIANATGKKYVKLNAVNCGVKEIKEVIESAKQDLFSFNGIILMLDEIQAMNKKQQQALLEVIEDGSVTLIASTADNPYFVIYKAILSRSSIFEFKTIDKNDIYKGLKRAVKKLPEFYTYDYINIEDEALKAIAETCNGDMRTALNKLELAFNLGIDIAANSVYITLDTVLESSNTKILSFDRGGDDGYSILSAFHKSLRGSDADAAIHYLARLVKAEDMQGITRRLLCVASEDVGLAVPQAITITEACVSSALQLGFPEARIPLAQATVYLAQCPKSNSVVTAIDLALEDLDNIETGDIPLHLKDAHYSGAKDLGRGVDYKYPHDYPNNYVKQQYLPESIKNKKYYTHGNNKNELAFKHFWDNLKK
ncbi:replication-associated recombination protein A [Romboutsia sp. CE17]|uniref:replication-associated recombination protein A n=1 Tax=Romboutsia sp. CE17 TaxID=2724150 RepID=UPI001442C2EF|nr:replication-associated recombination protein A [Romboutsia sp. CE17]QJA09129.1 replication-associated recombination protein A [Romboutsia sp. CE17]